MQKYFYGGFHDIEYTKGLFRVMLNAPQYTRKEKLQQMVALYAAERTLEKGYTNYVLLNPGSSFRKSFENGTVRQDLANGTLQDRLSSYSQVQPKGMFGSSALPLVTIYVLMLTEAEARKIKSFSARQTVAELKPLLVPDKKKPESRPRQS